MYLGQVLFYALDRLFLEFGHAISDAAIIVMGGSSIVDADVRLWTPPHVSLFCHINFLALLF
jgi:hypothetical protein